MVAFLIYCEQVVTLLHVHCPQVADGNIYERITQAARDPDAHAADVSPSSPDPNPSRHPADAATCSSHPAAWEPGKEDQLDNLNRLDNGANPVADYRALENEGTAAASNSAPCADTDVPGH